MGENDWKGSGGPIVLLTHTKLRTRASSPRFARFDLSVGIVVIPQGFTMCYRLGVKLKCNEQLFSTAFTSEGGMGNG